MKKKTKIIAGIAAFILIGGLLFFANALVGNPISKFLANKSAKEYIEENYQDMELEVGDATYNFKNGNYYVNVNSPTSIDTHFSLDISQSGDITYDSYEDYVLDKFNTWERINEEYMVMVEKVFRSEDFPYKSDIDYGEIKLKEKDLYESFGPEYGLNLEELEIDKIYDIKELAKTDGHIVLYIEDKEVNAERASEILLNVKELFDKKDVPFYAIDFSLEEPRTEDEKEFHDRKIFDVGEFLYSDIYKEDLSEKLEKAEKELEEYYKIQDDKMKKM